MNNGIPPPATLLDIVQQISGRLSPPIVDVFFTITDFRDLLSGGRRAPQTGYKIALGAVHPNVELAGRTLQVRNDGATLRFSIDPEEGPELYNAIAVTFARVDNTVPKAIYFNHGQQTGAYTPFSALKLNGNVFQFTNTLTGGHQQTVLSRKFEPGTSALDAIVKARDVAVQAAKNPAKQAGSTAPDKEAKPIKGPKWETYKFSVIIQRHSDGAVGIIDPPIENEGDPQAGHVVNTQN